MRNPRTSGLAYNDPAFVRRVSAFNRRAESKLRRSLFVDSRANRGVPSANFRFTFADGADPVVVAKAALALEAAGALPGQVALPALAMAA